MPLFYNHHFLYYKSNYRSYYRIAHGLISSTPLKTSLLAFYTHVCKFTRYYLGMIGMNFQGQRDPQVKLLTLKNHVIYELNRTKMHFARKISPYVLTISMLVFILLTSSFISTMFVHKAVYAQSSNTGFGNTTNLSLPNGKSIAINYLVNT